MVFTRDQDAKSPNTQKSHKNTVHGVCSSQLPVLTISSAICFLCLKFQAFLLKEATFLALVVVEILKATLSRAVHKMRGKEPGGMIQILGMSGARWNAGIRKLGIAVNSSTHGCICISEQLG